CFQYYGGYWTF
nr:immunoglobulin light chain junction region [Macaca mulatta]